VLQNADVEGEISTAVAVPRRCANLCVWIADESFCRLRRIRS